MKLIKEITQEVEYITESLDNGKKSTFIKGIFMQAEQANRNNRIYQKPVLEKEVERYQALIKERRALGELGHPLLS